jgi:hypothetical protein
MDRKSPKTSKIIRKKFWTFWRWLNPRALCLGPALPLSIGRRLPVFRLTNYVIYNHVIVSVFPEEQVQFWPLTHSNYTTTIQCTAFHWVLKCSPYTATIKPYCKIGVYCTWLPPGSISFSTPSSWLLWLVGSITQEWWLLFASINNLCPEQTTRYHLRHFVVLLCNHSRPFHWCNHMHSTINRGCVTSAGWMLRQYRGLDVYVVISRV